MSNLLPHTDIQLLLNTNFHHTHRLIELPKDVEDALVNGQEIYIKGSPDDEAVLCTNDKTYALREVHLSNSLLLTRPTEHLNPTHPPSPSYTIFDRLASTLELIPTRPRTERLRTELAVYQGPDREPLDAPAGKTFHELLEVVQASEEELRSGLRELGGVEIEGRWRTLDKKYEHLVLDLVLQTCIAEDLGLDAVRKSDVVRVMDEPEFVIQHVLARYAEVVSEGVYKLSREKVVRFMGQQLLRSQKDKRWPLDDFMLLWQKMVPDEFTVSLDLLKGDYLLDTEVFHQYLNYFPRSELPIEPAERFRALFAERARWEAAELLPYVEDLAADKKKLDALLLKHCRSSKADGKTIYTHRVK
ncbi:uncharacterized protein VTP21DRAFT_9261 [Calcarisporiella thermophila]|uniref:uncharacterized protein n=1 Tax=Calcarisporiella thermophila TaxID=911321 RepID=UPI003742CEAB